MTTRLQKNVKQYFKDNIGIIGALLILCIFLSVFPKTSGSFLTQKNIFNVLRQISSNLFLACGMTMVIILGVRWLHHRPFRLLCSRLRVPLRPSNRSRRAGRRAGGHRGGYV